MLTRTLLACLQVLKIGGSTGQSGRMRTNQTAVVGVACRERACFHRLFELLMWEYLCVLLTCLFTDCFACSDEDRRLSSCKKVCRSWWDSLQFCQHWTQFVKHPEAGLVAELLSRLRFHHQKQQLLWRACNRTVKRLQTSSHSESRSGRREYKDVHRVSKMSFVMSLCEHVQNSTTDPAGSLRHRCEQLEGRRRRDHTIWK